MTSPGSSRRVALVTGAARGIGESVARRLASDGLLVVVTDIDHPEGQTVAASLEDSAVYRGLDVRSEDEWRSVVDDVLERFGLLRRARALTSLRSPARTAAPRR